MVVPCICGFAMIIAHSIVQINMAHKITIFIDLGMFNNICCILYLVLPLLQNMTVHAVMIICMTSSAISEKGDNGTVTLHVNMTRKDADKYINKRYATKEEKRNFDAEK